MSTGDRRRRNCRVFFGAVVLTSAATVALIFQTTLIDRSNYWSNNNRHDADVSKQFLRWPKTAPSDGDEIFESDRHRLDLVSAKPRNPVEGGNLSYDELKSGLYEPFNVNGSDVIVFLHVQKTGGTTFEQYLVKSLAVPTPCRCESGRKKCQCRRPSGKGVWLFSRFSTGWSCGLHADWTELVVSGCVENVLARKERRENAAAGIKPGGRRIARRYFLTTFLREPISRYLSEFYHMRRGATWSASRHLCNGRPPYADELPTCFNADAGWSRVSLEEFTNCEWNLADNRQTRMLADLTLVGCYNRSAMSPDRRDRLMLRSAKENLSKMTFFGLLDDMRRSQYIFERTFDLQFNKPLLNLNESTDISELSVEQLTKIRRLNALDLELYAFAKRVFETRFQELKRTDALYDLNMAS